jgi:hypothetical protein
MIAKGKETTRKTKTLVNGSWRDSFGMVRTGLVWFRIRTSGEFL